MSEISVVAGVVTFTRVTEPRNVCERTVPVSTFGAGRLAGRRLELQDLGPHEHEHALADACARAPHRGRAACRRARTVPVPESTTFDSSRFIVPMNSATNGVAGAPYISRRRAHLLDHGRGT